MDKYGAEDEGVNSLRFLGFVNGYPRPYHYFYDRLPYALFFRDRFPEVPFFDLKKMDFLSFGGERVDVGELNSYSLERRGIFIVPSKIGPRFDHMTASVMVRNNFSVAVGKDGFSNKFVAWIGLCSEKRAWPERESSVIRIIEYILSVKTDVVFVFDGMTSPESDDVDVFRERHCSSELDNMSLVLSALGREIDYVDLIGAKAKDKILASMGVDVFFTSALTDSMWPAHFGRAKGLAYCARVANYSVHDHPNTRFIDSAFINDLDDGVANWARKGFSISVDDAFMSFKNFFDEEFLGR